MNEPSVHTEFLPAAGRFYLGATAGALAQWLLFDGLALPYYVFTALATGIAAALLGKPLFRGLAGVFLFFWDILDQDACSYVLLLPGYRRWSQVTAIQPCASA